MSDDPVDPIAAAKRALRVRVREQRSVMSDADRGDAADAIARQVLAMAPRTPSLITAYVAAPTEPATAELIAALRGLGHTVVLPRVAGLHLTWLATDADTELRSGAFGLLEPTSGDPVALRDVALILLPALAADADGRRLGQGGGYYDRALASVPPRAAGGPLLSAIVYDAELLDEVPEDVHDHRVDVIITPSRLLHIG